MASATLTTMDPVLKQLYRYEKIIELCYEDHPFLAMVPKFESFTGRNMPIPIRYGRPQGRASYFSTAQTNATYSRFEDFLITMSKNYGVATVDGMTADLSESSRGAFISAMTAEIDGIMQEVARDLSRNLFRDETGVIGTVSSTVACTDTVLTLSDVADVVMFEVGMQLCNTNASTKVIITAAGEPITAIDRASGTLTAADWKDIGASGSTVPAGGTGLCVYGDHLTATSDVASQGGTRGKLAGLQSWLLTESNATAFFGVTRSVDSRLWGTYHDGSSDSREDALINAQSKAAVEGGKVDVIFVNNADYRGLITDLGSKVQYEQASAQSGKGNVANMAFKAVTVHGDHGPIKVIADPDCPKGTAFGLEMKSWTLLSAGQAPKILMRDGLRIQRQASADGYEVRCGYYANLACDAPGHNVRINMPS